MTVEPWPTVTVDGTDYWEVDIKARLAKESDPDSQVLFLIGTPNGGVGSVGPLVQGAPGLPAEISPFITNTPLTYDDPTADSMSWTTVTEPTDTTPGVYQLNATQRQGVPGTDGTAVLDPGSFDSPQVGQVPVVNSDLSAFVLASLPYGALYFPATISDTTAGNANSTLAVCGFTSPPTDCKLIPCGYTIITGTGSDISVDLIARLNGETGGNIIGRCPGLGTLKDRLAFSGAVSPPGSADGYTRVPASTATTVHFRTERQSGTDTYTTSNSTSLFGVFAVPIQ